MSEPCYCGSVDCSECHPELHHVVTCPCCGTDYWLYEGTVNRDGEDVCFDCETMVCCEYCGEWYDLNDYNSCPDCEEEEEVK